MKDKSINFAALADAEPDAFSITALDRGSDVCVIAPHGGKIEPGTSELARAVASDTWSLYLFEGRKNSGNRDLHITSTTFNEPRGDALVRKSEVAIAFHGCSGEGETIFLGGLHKRLIEKMGKNLLDAGFAVARHNDPDLQGINIANICNRCQSGMGVQFEMTIALRDRLKNPERNSEHPNLSDLVDAIRRAI
ncbi:poly-gamma-glutamate hydrolase family protein [Sinorhizobium meliloti]|uniref:poly-gamma-glutamate hydrolase family protein n=1 Tax=Rhizobium meliloti TaxID=382 RepID=UPI00398CE5D6